jgi:hypothetical protein
MRLLKVLYISEKNELPSKLMPFSANADFRYATTLSSAVAAIAAAHYDYVLLDKLVPAAWQEKLYLLAEPDTKVERI